jgi:hypothetical protein
MARIRSKAEARRAVWGHLNGYMRATAMEEVFPEEHFTEPELEKLDLAWMDVQAACSRASRASK